VHDGLLAALLGGALIGLSASILLVLGGRIAGISSIVGGLVEPTRGSTAWRVAFLGGLFAGAALLAWRAPGTLTPHASAMPLVGVAFSGVLVGFGTQLGSGCTSGHGVCGLGRLSTRSLVAVVTFMASAAVTTFLTRHVLQVTP
jgi:uncharacterized membrane protein YedE/YeeE